MEFGKILQERDFEITSSQSAATAPKAVSPQTGVRRRMPKRQYQILMSDRVANGLRRVMETLRPVMPKMSRVLERGPMIGYLCRWFLTLDGAEQLRIISEGRRLLIEDGDEDGVVESRPNPDAMPTTVITDIVATPKQRKAAPKRKGPKSDSK